ncbi:MAG TPA: ABC transporter ATP-binding protein [Acidimicrobiales bacterium]|nr:ABC transporter ATP-binding protein [Acidimicrobiales bacterium]
MNVLEAGRLGKRYRRTWALRECTLAVPEGRIVALVGPNGSGKTTLLECAVGLAGPTEGSVSVLGDLSAGSPDALERVAFLAQDAPLHEYLSVRTMLELTRNLNRRFDQALAERRLAELGISLDHKVGKLSGGQQAQLALALALARHPDLLVLDEPLARLDPLARHDFMAGVMAAVADGGLSVIFSSHAVFELEHVADYLIVLAHGRVQMAGVIDDLLAGHGLLSGPVADIDRVTELFPVIHCVQAGRQAQLIVRVVTSAGPPNGWELDRVALEELVLAYLREPSASALPGPVAIAADQPAEAMR